MEIIPAIDIISGKCVRLTKGNYGTKKIYSDNPLKVALIFQSAGIKKIHLVDLDGAKAGKVKNWKTIEKFARATNLKLQVGGGFRGQEDIQRLLRLGPHEISFGTIALEAPQKLKKFLKKFGPEKIIADIGLKKGQVYVHGWQRKKTSRGFRSVLEMFLKLGVKTVICTDIERDGTLLGPNFSLYREILKKFPNFNIIASGGVRNIGDLKKLSKIGISGVIIGKAIYEKKIRLNDLKELL